MDIPADLHQRIKEARNIEAMEPEDCDSTNMVINCKIIHYDEELKQSIEYYNNNTFLIPMHHNVSLTRGISFRLRKVLEKWSNLPLHKDPFMPRIRRYTQGASLILHIDYLPDLTISALLQVFLT